MILPLMSMAIRALDALFDALFYRLRGGGFYQFGNDTTPRLLWAGKYAVSQLLVSWPDIDVIQCSLSFALMFLAIAAVPHAFAQGMGRSISPQHAWPAFMVPPLTQVEWNSFTLLERALYDFIQMSGVAFVRGIIVYAPIAFITQDYAHAVRSIALITLLKPVAYAIGYEISLTIQSIFLQKKLGERYGSIAQARSTEWGELLTGLSWAISI